MKKLFLFLMLLCITSFASSAGLFPSSTQTNYFTQLLDTPNSYSGSADYCVTVNSGETGVEFTNCSTGGGGSGAIDLVNGGNNYIYVNTTTGDVYVFLNESVLNQTIESFDYIAFSDEPNLNVNSSDHWDGLDTYNTTVFEEQTGGVLGISFSWLTTFINNFGYITLDDYWTNASNEFRFYTDTTYTTQINANGNPTAIRLGGNINANNKDITGVSLITASNWSDVNISESQIYDLNHTGGGGGGNPFDQDLNTTSNVTFANVDVSGNITAENITGNVGKFTGGVNTVGGGVDALTVSANNYIFTVGGGVGMGFFTANPRRVTWNYSGGEIHQLWWGSSGVDGGWYHKPRTSSPSSATDGASFTINESGYFRDMRHEQGSWVTANCQEVFFEFNHQSLNAQKYMKAGNSVTASTRGYLVDKSGSITSMAVTGLAVVVFGNETAQFEMRINGTNMGAFQGVGGSALSWYNMTRWERGVHTFGSGDILSNYYNRTSGLMAGGNTILKVGIIFDDC